MPVLQEETRTHIISCCSSAPCHYLCHLSGLPFGLEFSPHPILFLPHCFRIRDSEADPCPSGSGLRSPSFCSIGLCTECTVSLCCVAGCLTATKRRSARPGLVIKTIWGTESTSWPITPALTRLVLDVGVGLKVSLRALERWLNS